MPPETGIPMFGIGAVPVSCGTGAHSTSRTGHIGQGQSVGRGRPQDLQVKSSGQAGQMTCYHCRQPGHMRRDCPRRQRSHDTEAERSD